MRILSSMHLGTAIFCRWKLAPLHHQTFGLRDRVRTDSPLTGYRSSCDQANMTSAESAGGSENMDLGALEVLPQQCAPLHLHLTKDFYGRATLAGNRFPQGELVCFESSAHSSGYGASQMDKATAMDVDESHTAQEEAVEGASNGPTASIPVVNLAEVTANSTVPNLVTSWSNGSAKRVLTCIGNYDAGMLILVWTVCMRA